MSPRAHYCPVTFTEPPPCYARRLGRQGSHKVMFLLHWAGTYPHCSLSCKSLCLVQSLCSERTGNPPYHMGSCLLGLTQGRQDDIPVVCLSVCLSIILPDAPQPAHACPILIWKREILLMKCSIFFNQLLQLGTITTVLELDIIKCWFPNSRWGSCLYTGHKIHRSVKTSWNLKSLKHFCWRDNEL